MLLVIATKFQGLQSPVAMDHAQLARHLSDGEGFTTSLIRPLSLVFTADVTHHPDLYNAPLHPLVLALFFQMLHPGDRVAAVAGAILWSISVWLTYITARSLFGKNAAAVATVFWGANLAGIVSAVEGLPNPLMAIAVTLAAWVAVPRFDDDGQQSYHRMPPWRAILLGAVAGVVFLTHPLLIVVALTLVLFLVMSRHRKWESVLFFGAGFLMAVLPWMIRNASVGAPMLGLYWYEALSSTISYPGDAVWRTLSLPQEPVSFLVGHPLETARKLSLGLADMRAGVFGVIDPVVACLFLGAVFAFRHTHRRRQFAGIVWVSLLLGGLGACLSRAEPGLLLAWGPLISILAAAQFVNWIHQHVGRGPVPEEPRPAQAESKQVSGVRYKSAKRSIFKRLALALPWNRIGCYAVIFGAAAFPLVFYILIDRPVPGPKPRDEFLPLGRSLREGAVVMTDQPAPLAWYTGHPSVLLVQREEELDRYERVLGPIDAVLATPPLLQVAVNERGDWWPWIVAPRGIYRGLVPAQHMPSSMLLRIRGGSEK